MEVKIDLRNQKIVNRSLQYRVILVIAASGITISIGALICIKLLSLQIMALLDVGEINNEMALAVIGSINQMTIYFIFLIFFAVFLAWIASLYLSNRIAGPIYNINRILDLYLAGEKNLRIQIREKDFFSDLADKLNRILAEKTESSTPPKE